MTTTTMMTLRCDSVKEHKQHPLVLVEGALAVLEKSKTGLV